MFRAGGAVPESAEPDSPVAGVAVDTGSGQRDVKFNKRASRERRVALNFGSAHRERLLEKEIIMPDVTGALGTVVLVHGGFVDASGWEDVYKKRPSSWPTRSFPGAWKPSTGPSANQRGRPSRAGTWSQPRTR